MPCTLPAADVDDGDIDDENEDEDEVMASFASSTEVRGVVAVE